MSTFAAEQTGIVALPETIGIFDRLDMLRRQAGFLATTRGELNEAFGLLTFIETPGGAGTHLAEIGAHQNAHGADPVPAQLSVTREYTGYAGRARYDRSTLVTLQEEIQARETAHPFSTLDPGSLYTGRGQLARYMDLAKLAADKDPSKFPFVPLRGYTKGERNAVDPYTVDRPKPEVAAHIDATLGKIRTGMAPKIVAAAIHDQHNRFTFWKDRLVEIESHQTGAARAAARKSLESFGIRNR